MDKLKLTGNAFFFEGFKVTADSLQYTVRERKTIKESKDPKKVGTETWGNEKFFPALSSVFNYLAERTCKEHIGNLNTAIKKIDGLRKMVKTITKLQENEK